MRVFERCALEPAQWAVVMTEHRTPKLSAESQALYHLTTSPPKWADVMGMYSKVDFSQCVEALSCVTVDQELLLIGKSFFPDFILTVRVPDLLKWYIFRYTYRAVIVLY